MKKKLLAVLAAFVIAGTANVFALGIGAQGGYTVGGNGGAALSLKVDSLPCVLAIDLGFGTNYVSVGGTADWWLANPTIDGAWKYYYGVGVGAGIGIGDYSDLTIGPRALIGTNLFLLDGFLELYLQAAWQPSFHMWLGSNKGAADFWWGYVPLNVGFRFWF